MKKTSTPTEYVLEVDDELRPQLRSEFCRTYTMKLATHREIYQISLASLREKHHAFFNSQHAVECAVTQVAGLASRLKRLQDQLFFGFSDNISALRFFHLLSERRLTWYKASAFKCYSFLQSVEDHERRCALYLFVQLQSSARSFLISLLKDWGSSDRYSRGFIKTFALLTEIMQVVARNEASSFNLRLKVKGRRDRVIQFNLSVVFKDVRRMIKEIRALATPIILSCDAIRHKLWPEQENYCGKEEDEKA